MTVSYLVGSSMTYRCRTHTQCVNSLTYPTHLMWAFRSGRIPVISCAVKLGSLRRSFQKVLLALIMVMVLYSKFHISLNKHNSVVKWFMLYFHLLAS